MISTAVIFSTGCMSESIMNVNQVSAVVKTVYFASFFIVCKLRAVVSISERQTVSFLRSGIFCNTLYTCLLYTSDAADEEDSVDLGGRGIIKQKKSSDKSSSRRID